MSLRLKFRNKVVLPILHRSLLYTCGIDLYSLIHRAQRCEKAAQDVSRALESIAENPERLWLYGNRVERMDATDELFDEGRRFFHLDRYEFAAKRCAGLSVADIACGTGYGAEMLKTMGNASSVIGIDISTEAIDYARRNYLTDGIEFLRSPGDETTLPSSSLDMICSFETIEHVPEDTKLLLEFARLLKPEGTLVISTPNEWPLETNPFHLRVYNRKNFLEVLSSLFDVIELYNQNSGTSSPYNRGQKRGIVPTTDENHTNAECFLAICKPLKAPKG